MVCAAMLTSAARHHSPGASSRKCSRRRQGQARSRSGFDGGSPPRLGRCGQQYWRHHRGERHLEDDVSCTVLRRSRGQHGHCAHDFLFILASRFVTRSSHSFTCRTWLIVVVVLKAGTILLGSVPNGVDLDDVQQDLEKVSNGSDLFSLSQHAHWYLGPWRCLGPRAARLEIESTEVHCICPYCRCRNALPQFSGCCQDFV